MAALLITAGTGGGALVATLATLVVVPVGALIGWLRRVIAPGTDDLALATPLTMVGIAVAIGLLLDVLALTTGRPKPLTGGRQVPQEWTRLLDPRVVAMLFGARLGVGPLTILSTWSWWSFTIGAALLGVGSAALVGATFGFVRLTVTVGVSIWVERRDRPIWFGRLRSRRRPGWATINGAGLLVLATVMIAACGSDADSLPRLVEPGEANESMAASAADPGSARSTRNPAAPPESGRPLNEPFDRESDISLDDALLDGDHLPQTTTPARLEDFVHDPANPTATLPAPTALLDTASSEPSALAEALTDSIEGFVSIDGPEADRFLSLADASDLQPDPTEEVALLETRGFEGGWTRAFRNPVNDVAVVSVYHFADATQAEFYLEDGLITIGGYGGSFFDIEGLPGVRGFSQDFVDGDEELRSLGAAFQSGPRWFLAYIVGRPDTVTPDVLVPVITDHLSSAASP